VDEASIGGMTEHRHETLTIVFTDLERSTEMLERLGERGWLAEFAAHEADVGRLAAEHGGRRVKSMGDGFLLVFTSTQAAVRFGLACLDVTTNVRMRIGMHLGEAIIESDDVHGRAVVKAARISAAARGGELLVSSVVRELADDGDPTVLYGPPRELVLKGLEGRHVMHRVERVIPEEQQALRVVIADDAVIVRDGLAALLRAGGHDVAAAVGDGESLLAAVVNEEPNVAIVDIRMPPTHTDEGLVAAERIRASHPSVGIMLLSQHADPALAVRLLNSSSDGGVGYLLKDRISNLDLLIDGLRRVAAGETVIDAEVSERMVRRRSSDLGELTDREREVLALIAEGRSNRWIAQHLFVTSKTLEGHVSRIFMKLGLTDTPDEHRRVAAVLAYLGHRG
jgi:DNA-binding NarL/FixJ family response regulator/class 3 adenylate cyclase